jgi:GNAT superfamily N-acetyltransferase
MVQELIRRLFEVDLTEQSVGRLLRRLGMSPQRPVTRAYEQDSGAVRHRKTVTFPKIKAEAVLDGRWVALVGFGSAALSYAARDRHVGWSREQQYARLRHVVNNQRFCVLPAGQRPNLASAVLARALRRVDADYLAVYGHRVLAVETFHRPGAAHRRLLRGRELSPGRRHPRVLPQRG